ncbi:MAG: cyclophilin-like fold protein [Nitrospiraceae bacterium]|nr:cyclophilin-like fold protein [Nitrospiraceae bacterium]
MKNVDLMRIKIQVGGVELEARLLDNETARAVYDLLPVEGYNNVWGDEFYFEIPLYMPPDDSATTEVVVGDIGYWPPGKSIAIFFGPTPLSKADGRPVPAGPVNLIGRISGDAAALRKARDFNPITLEKA